MEDNETKTAEEITEEAYIEIRSFTHGGFDSNDSKEVKELILNAMEEYANQSKWVSVEYGLPEERRKFYWTYTERGRICKSYIYKQDKIWHNDFELITHWQPLPKPPNQ